MARGGVDYGLLRADGSSFVKPGIGEQHANSPGQYSGLLDAIDAGAFEDARSRRRRAAGIPDDGRGELRQLLESGILDGKDARGEDGRAGAWETEKEYGRAAHRSEKRVAARLDDIIHTKPRTWFERRWTQTKLARGMRHIINLLHEVHCTPQLSLGFYDEKWKERTRFITKIHGGSDVHFAVEVPEKPLFRLPRKNDLVLSMRSKKPGFQINYHVADDSYEVKTASKVLMREQPFDMNELRRESVRDRAAGRVSASPVLMNNAKSLKHLWVLMNFKTNVDRHPDCSAEMHVPFLKENMLQLKYNCTALRRLELWRLHVRGSVKLRNRTALGDALWFMPSYDVGKRVTTVALQQELCVHLIVAEYLPLNAMLLCVCVYARPVVHLYCLMYS